MKHAMRTKRLRQQRAERQRQAWASILVKGGLLACAPGVLDRLDPEFVESIRASGVMVKESPHAPPGMIYGMAPQPPLIKSVPDFEFHLSYIKADA